MSCEKAIEEGYAWKSKIKRYVFKSCKLVDNCVQPIPKSETHIENKTMTKVSINHSIF